MLRRVFPVFACVVILAGLASEASARGNKKGPDDLYLEVDPGVRLADFRGTTVILEPATIEADGDRPKDNEVVRSNSDELLAAALKNSKLFSAVVTGAPADLPEGRVLRATTRLTMEYGSRLARAIIKFGAGKSKIHIHLDLTDARTGQHVAFFNGYGAGVGFMTFAGGNAVKLAKEDLEDNYEELSSLLEEKMQ
jgi:hypothetical protein